MESKPSVALTIQNQPLTSLAWQQVQQLLGDYGFHLPCQDACLSLDAAGNDLGGYDDLAQYKQLCCLSLARTGLHRLLLGVYPLAITHLSLEGNKLTSLSGLAVCSNLRWLDASCNEITDVWALAECQHLQEVCLSKNQINRLGALASLHKLEALYIDGCAVKTELQLRVLSSLPKLKRLWIGGNPLVTSLAPRRMRMLVLNLLPGLTMLDGCPLSRHRQRSMDTGLQAAAQSLPLPRPLFACRESSDTAGASECGTPPRITVVPEDIARAFAKLAFGASDTSENLPPQSMRTKRSMAPSSQGSIGANQDSAIASLQSTRKRGPQETKRRKQEATSKIAHIWQSRPIASPESTLRGEDAAPCQQGMGAYQLSVPASPQGGRLLPQSSGNPAPKKKSGSVRTGRPNYPFPKIMDASALMPPPAEGIIHPALSSFSLPHTPSSHPHKAPARAKMALKEIISPVIPSALTRPVPLGAADVPVPLRHATHSDPVLPSSGEKTVSRDDNPKTPSMHVSHEHGKPAVLAGDVPHAVHPPQAEAEGQNHPLPLSQGGTSTPADRVQKLEVSFQTKGLPKAPLCVPARSGRDTKTSQETGSPNVPAGHVSWVEPEQQEVGSNFPRLQDTDLAGLHIVIGPRPSFTSAGSEAGYHGPGTPRPHDPDDSDRCRPNRAATEVPGWEQGPDALLPPEKMSEMGPGTAQAQEATQEAMAHVLTTGSGQNMKKSRVKRVFQGLLSGPTSASKVPDEKATAVLIRKGQAGAGNDGTRVPHIKLGATANNELRSPRQPPTGIFLSPPLTPHNTVPESNSSRPTVETTPA